MLKIGPILIEKISETIHLNSFVISHRMGLNSFTRMRKLSFVKIFTAILSLVKKSLGIECELLETDLDGETPSKQAFSKSRNKLSHTGFQ